MSHSKPPQPVVADPSASMATWTKSSSDDAHESYVLNENVHVPDAQL
jgi:hypothetical protein